MGAVGTLGQAGRSTKQRSAPAAARMGTHVLSDVVGVALVVKLRPPVYVVTVMTSVDIVFVGDPGSAGADDARGAEPSKSCLRGIASTAVQRGAALRAYIPR